MPDNDISVHIGNDVLHFPAGTQKSVIDIAVKKRTQKSQPPPSPPGFAEQLSTRTLGVKPGEILPNLMQTAGKALTPWRPPSREWLAAGAKEYVTATATGLAELGKEVLPLTGLAGFALSRIPALKPQDPTAAIGAVTGLGDIADVPGLVRKRQYAGAAGAAAAGVIKMLPA
jgi:hypothetical protein